MQNSSWLHWDYLTDFSFKSRKVLLLIAHINMYFSEIIVDQRHSAIRQRCLTKNSERYTRWMHLWPVTCFFLNCIFQVTGVWNVPAVQWGQREGRRRLLGQQVISQLFVCKVIFLQALLGPGLRPLHLRPQRVHVGGIYHTKGRRRKLEEDDQLFFFFFKTTYYTELYLYDGFEAKRDS